MALAIASASVVVRATFLAVDAMSKELSVAVVPIRCVCVHLCLPI